MRGPSCGEGQRTRLRLPLRHRARCDQTPLQAPRSLRQDCAPKGAGRLVAAPSRLGSATARSTETTFAFLAPIPRSTALVRAAPSPTYLWARTSDGERGRGGCGWAFSVQSRGPLFGRRRGGRALAAARPVPELGLGLRSARGESDSPRAAWSALRCWGPPGLVWVLRVEGRATGGSIGRLLPGHGHGRLRLGGCRNRRCRDGGDAVRIICSRPHIRSVATLSLGDVIAVASVRVIMAAADHEAAVAKAVYTEKQPCKSFVRCRGSCATAVRRRPYISCNGCYRLHWHMSCT